MKSESEIRAHLLEKAAADSAFRARLVAEPKAAVEQEFNLPVPDGFSLHVHEESATSFHLVLPPVGGRLRPEEMKSVAGGGYGHVGIHTEDWW